jgi:hypothetical protein
MYYSVVFFSAAVVFRRLENRLREGVAQSVALVALA